MVGGCGGVFARNNNKQHTSVTVSVCLGPKDAVAPASFGILFGRRRRRTKPIINKNACYKGSRGGDSGGSRGGSLVLADTHSEFLLVFLLTPPTATVPPPSISPPPADKENCDGIEFICSTQTYEAADERRERERGSSCSWRGLAAVAVKSPKL